MREIIYEDVATKIRTTVRYEMTQKGVRQTTSTELIPDKVAEELTEEDDVIFDNYDEELSINAGRGYYVYDKMIRTAKDGHKTYSFNDSLITDFDMVFDCDNRGITDGYFYILHNIEKAELKKMVFKEIDEYSKDARVKLIVNNDIVLDFTVADLKSDKPPEFIYSLATLSHNTPPESKWEIYISGNTNTLARGKLILSFYSEPEFGVRISDVRHKYNDNEGGG